MGERDRATAYAASGVDTGRAEEALSRLRRWVERSFSLNPAATVELPLGYFANVIRLAGLPLGLAITADGVGTKLLVAEMMRKFDTVGIDCVAMNVNDLLCVGATPITFVDYVAAEDLNADVLDEIGRGLFRGAQMARVSIAGGEIAQLPEMVRGAEPGRGIDLAGAAVGTVPLDRLLVGQDARAGDAVVGLASSGIHSNGLSLARRIVFRDRGLSPDAYVPELRRAVGEELLEPTRIYVPEALEMLESGLDVKAFAHMTGGGFFNLVRTKAPVGFVIHTLPDPPPIFPLLQELGGLEDGEMFEVYNMGVGFCVVVAERDAAGVIDIATRHGTPAWEMGVAVADQRRTITLEPRHLRSEGRRLVKV